MNAVEKLNTGKSADENGIKYFQLHIKFPIKSYCFCCYESCEFAGCFFGEASL
jgi:hypothetical protein